MGEDATTGWRRDKVTSRRMEATVLEAEAEMAPAALSYEQLENSAVRVGTSDKPVCWLLAPTDKGRP